MKLHAVPKRGLGIGARSWEALRRLRAALPSALALGLMLPLGALAAGASETKLTVTATILTHASLITLAQPSSVLVTAADIARGYVDVAAPARVDIKSNSPRGYMLVVTSEGDFVRHTRIKGLGSDVQLGAGGGVIPQPAAGRGMSKATLDLGFRFALTESARQGVYSWPLRIDVAPL